METLETSKHLTSPGCHYLSPPTRFKLDAWRGSAGIYQETLRCRQTWTCKWPSVVLSHAYSRRQLSDVANGLCYLHSCNVIHGDLKGVRTRYMSRFATVLTPGQPNILIDNSGHAHIADFGLAMLAHNLDSTQSATTQQGYTPRWAAPEVLSKGSYSKEADIFSFAMVMIEVRHGLLTVCRALVYFHFVSIQVFTGAVPFSDRSAFAVVLATMQGKRPPRPTHPTFTESLWTLMERCWDHKPRLRPKVSEVLQVLLTPLVSHSFWLSPIHRLNCAPACSGLPVWKWLISYPLSKHERIPLIMSIFSDHNGVEVVGRLSGDDARAFVDVIDEACLTSEEWIG